MFGAGCGDVGVMMRHGNCGQTVVVGKIDGGSRTVVIRVQVVCDDLWRDLQQIQHAADGLVEKTTGGRVVKIADMWRQIGFVAASQTNAALEMRAEGHHRSTGVWQADRIGRVTPALSLIHI